VTGDIEYDAVMNVDRIDFDAYESALPQTGWDVFHHPDALRTVADHADGACRLYAARKGQETIGLLPAFVTERAVGKTVLSPPPGFSIPRLGPLLMPNSPKRSKRERLNQSLVDAVLADVDAVESTTLFRLSTPLTYEDPRPLWWNDLSVEPRFTYVIDLPADAEIDDVMGRFGRSLRREMRKRDALDLTISDEGLDGARRIHHEVEQRFAEQDELPPAPRAFAEDVVRALEDRARAYVARDEAGTYHGGVIVLYSADLAYYWLGGVRNSYENVSVNTLIHRRVMEDVLTDPTLDSVSGYDLVGANTERLCEYKQQFCGDLVPYYLAESDGFGMRAVKTAYRVFQSGSLRS
jgi:hypothetical protein